MIFGQLFNITTLSCYLCVHSSAAQCDLHRYQSWHLSSFSCSWWVRKSPARRRMTTSSMGSVRVHRSLWILDTFTMSPGPSRWSRGSRSQSLPISRSSRRSPPTPPWASRWSRQLTESTFPFHAARLLLGTLDLVTMTETAFSPTLCSPSSQNCSAIRKVKNMQLPFQLQGQLPLLRRQTCGQNYNPTVAPPVRIVKP